MTFSDDYAELAKIEARARVERAQVMRGGIVAVSKAVTELFGGVFARTKKAV